MSVRYGERVLEGATVEHLMGSGMFRIQAEGWNGELPPEGAVLEIDRGYAVRRVVITDTRVFLMPGSLWEVWHLTAASVDAPLLPDA